MILSALHAAPRLRLSAAMALSASALVFLAAAGTSNPVFDGDRLNDVAAHLSRLSGRPVRAGLALRGGSLVLEIRYLPSAEEFRAEAAGTGRMRQLMEQALIRYAGFVEEVDVRAVPPREFLASGGLPGEVRMSRGLLDLLRGFDRADILAYGDRHWPIRAEAMRPWRFVMIHHSGADHGSAAIIDRGHRRRGWDGLGYHFVIGNGRGSGDGQVEPGGRWERQAAGAHAGVEQYNEEAVGICLIGNFSAQTADSEREGPASARLPAGPTEGQMGSLRVLVLYLTLKLNLPAEALLLHRDVRSTTCPGELFPREAFVSGIKRDLARLRGPR
jgi:hypothetical protein